jgi:hypothetical protein
MKKIKYSVVALIVVAVCVSIGYHFSYPIELNMLTLPNHISDFYNRGHSVKDSSAVVLFSGVGIGKNEYYMVEIGEDLGYVKLEKGLTGRYKISHLGYGDGNFRDGIIENNGKKYLLFCGRDITSQISKITVLINGQTYEMDIPKATNHFFVYTEIDNHVEDKQVNRDHINFYNDKAKDITELYNLSGGGIQ